MRFIFILVILLSTAPAIAQWEEVYRSDSCNCPQMIHWPVTEMNYFGSDTGIVFSSGHGGSIASSADAGDSWQIARLDSDVAANINPAYLSGIASFFNPKNFWICNGQAIYHSTDGGTNWEPERNNDMVASDNHSICFVDSLIGFEGGDGLSIWKSTDGGSSWIRVHGPETNDFTDYEVYQIRFCNPKLGIATCGNFNTYVLRTIDSGKTWKNVTNLSQGVAGFEPTSLSYPDPQNAWLTDYYQLYRSSDSGLTWSQVNMSKPPGNDLRSISFIDSIHGVAVAGGRNLILGYTSDGGQSWNTQTIDSAGPGGFVAFPDASVAFASGQDAVYRLKIGDLAVAATAPSPAGVRLEANAGNFSIVMPLNSGGRVRIMDELGRALEARELSPGARWELDSHFHGNDIKRFLFIEVESGGKIQVFKVLE